MTSLSIDQGQGGFFFGRQDSIPAHRTSPQEEDLSHDASSLHAGLMTEPSFHRLSTAWVVILELLLLIGYAVALFVLDHVDISFTWISTGQEALFDFLILIHVALWLVIFLADRYLQHAHHISQGLGYLKLFRETKEIRRMPYNVLCLGNAVLLVLTALFANDNKIKPVIKMVQVLQIVFMLELVIMLPGIIWYLVKVIKFNKSKPAPDAEDTDFLNGFTATGLSQTTSETGFRDGEYLDEILEKQADMIRYLQQHNANLGRRLMKVMQQQAQTSPSHTSIVPRDMMAPRLERTITN
ncbi:transmembrane protein 192 [Nematostella vectensis]|uniref:transmembrane protein 192 n=1 Tax=Nematostella vectensis TaxID=45351 RepID=UPI0020770054|nr:transmembrane protein 192 [Nematostella vectensis]